jgi:hypothetical protein
MNPRGAALATQMSREPPWNYTRVSAELWRDPVKLNVTATGGNCMDKFRTLLEYSSFYNRQEQIALNDIFHQN